MQEWCMEKENTDEALKCWNLEQIIEAESFGQSMPAELTMDDLVVDVDDEEEHVVIIVVN